MLLCNCVDSKTESRMKNWNHNVFIPVRRRPTHWNMCLKIPYANDKGHTDLSKPVDIRMLHVTFQDIG